MRMTSRRVNSCFVMLFILTHTFFFYMSPRALSLRRNRPPLCIGLLNQFSYIFVVFTNFISLQMHSIAFLSLVRLSASLHVYLSLCPFYLFLYLPLHPFLSTHRSVSLSVFPIVSFLPISRLPRPPTYL